MKDKIEKILKYAGLSPTQFADEIGVQRSSMSHILSERNKPSLEFVQKLLNRFKEINPEWLMFNKGEMLRESIQRSLFANTFEEDIANEPFNEIKSEAFKNENFNLTQTNIQSPELTKDTHETQEIENVSNDIIEKKQITQLPQENQEKAIDKIIIFYKDRTFGTYYPE